MVNFNTKASYSRVGVGRVGRTAGCAERKGLCAGRERGGRRNNLEEELMESGSKWIQITYLVLSSCETEAEVLAQTLLVWPNLLSSAMAEGLRPQILENCNLNLNVVGGYCSGTTLLTGRGNKRAWVRIWLWRKRRLEVLT